MDAGLTNTRTLILLENAVAYHQWIFEKIKSYMIGNVLEVGCGIGNLTRFLLKDRKVIASDVNEDYLEAIKNKYRHHPNLRGILLWDIEQAPSQKFNIPINTILCSNVLEHIKHDDVVLNNFFRLLPERGRVILLVPALEILYNSLDKDLGHYRRYSRGELIQKLTQNGFRICSLKYFNLFGIMGWFINGTLLRKRLLPAAQIRMFNKMVPLFIWMGKIIPTVVGQSLIIVGEKGS
jgi:2-polyprenyl-3-methyl-5-hydroxy-6-metoxy-1,4-benzoquinol methylase